MIGLLVAALLHGGTHPPIYDGLPSPEAPYRYVNPPPDLASSNQPPFSAQATLPVDKGKVPGGGLQTDDMQVLVFFGLGALEVGREAQSVLIRIDPVTQPPSPPAGSQIRGNVYRITVVEQPSGTSAMVVTSLHVRLRYPPGPFEELQFYDGTTWHILPTLPAGSGSPYAAANPAALGEFAATAPAGGQRQGLLGILVGLLADYGLILFVIVFGALAVISEVRRRKQHS